MIRFRPLTVRIEEVVDAEAVLGGVGGGVSSAAHAMSSRERGVAVTVVVIEHEGIDSILASVHPLVLSGLGLLALEHDGVPGLFVPHSTRLVLGPIMEALPHGLSRVGPPSKGPLVHLSIVVFGQKPAVTARLTL